MLPFEPTATVEDVATRIRAIAAAGRAGSFIRLSDGEGNILAHSPEDRAPSFKGTCNLMFGRKLDADELAVVQRDMGLAARHADILGLRTGTELDKDNRARAALPCYLDPDRLPLIGTAFLNIKLAQTGFWSDLLYGRPRIGLISCNDLRHEIATQLGIGTVDFWPVPSEAGRPTGRTFANQAQDNLSHMPNRYEELRRTLAVAVPGQIVLVGAGVLGKAYCGWIKERGGFALDLGSVLDGWARLPTRSYLIEGGDRHTLQPPKRARRVA